MLKKIINQFLYRRHYWRHVSFGEIAELYVSRTLTIFAINVAGVLVPVFLYKIGYSIVTIGCIYMLIFTLRFMLTSVNMKLIARFGPKHMIFWAGVLRIPALVSLLFVEQYGVSMIALYIAFMAIGPAIYEIAYNIDFSKVKHNDHAGKELGVMQILEKGAKALSPFVGGVLATLFSPQVTIGLAAILFVLAGIPLFHTAEPIKVKKAFTLRRPVRRIELDGLLARLAMSYGWLASAILWTLFMTLYVFDTQSNNIYAIIGGLASFSVLISVIAAWVFGKTVDKNGGRSLLRSSVVMTSMTHMAKPFITTPIGVVLVNTINETSTTGYIIAGTRAMFASADESGDRLFYYAMVEIGASLGAALGAAMFILAVFLVGEKAGMMSFFVIAGFAELFMLRLSRYADA